MSLTPHTDRIDAINAAERRRLRDANAELRKKALEMRNAIDSVELALSGIGGFEDVARLWDGAHDDLAVKVEMRVGLIRQFRSAYDELNRIINSPEYEPTNLEL